MEDDVGKNKARILSEAINNFGNVRVPSSTPICFPILTDKQLEAKRRSNKEYRDRIKSL